jgi:hypothetical protein
MGGGGITPAGIHAPAGGQRGGGGSMPGAPAASIA